MGKKKFNFRQDKSVDIPEKGIDELFEEQFKNRKTEEASSNLPPDIPMSLKDINKAVNNAAQSDEGEIQEEVLENMVNDDGEGTYDLEELNGESEEDIEDEISDIDKKKAKRKADCEKGRKNEKAYQKKSREMEEANRKHQEEMRKQSERLHEQEKSSNPVNNEYSNLVNSEAGNQVSNETSKDVNVSSDISDSTKRNQALIDDDYETERIKQAKAQKQKTDDMRTEQRAREEATKNYEGYGNKNIDFSGNNNHGRADSKSDSLYSDKNNSYNTPNQSTDGYVRDNNEYHSNKDSYSGQKNNIQSATDNDFSYNQSSSSQSSNSGEAVRNGFETQNPASHPSDSYESASRQQEKQYMDDDYAAKAQKEFDSRKAKLDSIRSGQSEKVAGHSQSQDLSGKDWKPTGKDQSSPIPSKEGHIKDNPSGNRVDYIQEEKENRKIHNKSDRNSISGLDKSQIHHEEQTSPLNDRRSNYQEQREDRSQIRNGNSTSESSKKKDNYRGDYNSRSGSMSGKSEPGNFSDIHRKTDTRQSHNSNGQSRDSRSSQSDIPTDNRSEANFTRPKRMSDYRSSNTSHKIGSGKDMDRDKNPIHVTAKNDSVKKSSGITILGTGRNLESNVDRNSISSLKEDRNIKINMMHNSRNNSSAVIINKPGGNMISSNCKDKIEIVFPTGKNNKPESPSGGGPIPSKNNPSGYKIKMSNMNGYRHVDKVEKDGKMLFENNHNINHGSKAKLIMGAGASIGVITQKGIDRVSHIKDNIKDKENKKPETIHMSTAHKSNDTPNGSTLTSQMHFNEKKKKEQNKAESKKETKQSIYNAKKEYAKTIGKGFTNAGGTIARSMKKQVWNSLKENDAVRTADKTRIIIGGALGAGAYFRTLGHNAGAGKNFLKAKGNALGDAGRYFKGTELKELKVVPHTTKQFTKEIGKYGKLANLKIKDIDSRIKMLKKIKKPTIEEAKMLKDLINLKNLKLGQSKFRLDKIKAERFKNAMSLLMQSLQSNDLSGQTLAYATSSFRYVRNGLKLVRQSVGVSLRMGNFAFKQGMRFGKWTNKTINKIPIVGNAKQAAGAAIKGTKPIQYINGKVVRVRNLKGNAVKGLTKQINGGMYKTASKAFQKNAPDKLKKAVSTVGSGAKKLNTGRKIVSGKVSSAKQKVKKVKNVVTKPFKVIAKPFQVIGKAFNWIKRKLILFAGVFVLIYIGLMLILEASLAVSMICSDTDNLQKYVNSLLEKQNEFDLDIVNYQNQGGKKHGKYKTVTINYLDENGNQIDSTNNLKEILSMVAVKIDNDWPDWYEIFDRNKVDKIAKQLFDDSHKIETTEIGPYSCSGCEERDYKCTDSLPADASADRIRLHDLYADRGGCKPYGESITYYCSDDTAKMPDGSTVSNAHTQRWANNYMKTLYDNYYSQGGDTIKHSDSYDNPASGCSNYRTEQYVKSTLSDDSSWPSTVTFTWNNTENRYEFSHGGTTWYLGVAKDGDSITYQYVNGRYETYGTKYICKEYKCDGHSTSITKYRCDGHHETYCPGDHYDLIVNAIVLHFPALYEADSTSLGMCEYPEDAGEDDFYWDEGNIDWCKTIYEQDWNDTYEGLVGLDGSSLTGDPLTQEEIDAYLDKLPEDLSTDRKKLIKAAFSGVGQIPYYWGGYASCAGLDGNNFGTTTTPDSNGRTKKGLDCSHFVDWACWTALNNNLGNGWTGTIWEQTTATNILELKPGDLGFQNEGQNTVNHVGIYLGDGLWIHCSGSAGNVTINKTTVFTLYRKLNIIS